MNAETYKNLQQLIEQYEKSIDCLKLMLHKKDTDFNLCDRTIKAGTSLHKGITIGIAIALDRIGEFPTTLNDK